MTQRKTERASRQDRNFFEKYRIKIAVAFLLTFASGLVDIVGYLGIFRLFTAHMTGTTVQLGRDAVSGNWPAAWAAAVAVASFLFLGSYFGRAVIQAASRMRFRRVTSVTLLLEAALQAGTAWYAAGRLDLVSQMRRHLLLAVLAAAMGLQMATLTGIGPLTVHTSRNWDAQQAGLALLVLASPSVLTISFAWDQPTRAHDWPER